MADFKVMFSEGGNAFEVGMQQKGTAFNAEMGEINVVHIGEPERYAGPYEARPTVEGFTLPTAEKLLTEDVKIAPIPYFEVSNTANGKTVTIC